MKQTIEIEVPDGKKAVWKDNKIVFEDIKPQLPKTWEEFCGQNPIKNIEYYIDAHCNTYGPGRRIRDIYEDRNILPSKMAAEQHLALMQLHQLRDCYRQGWIPDWEINSSKYSIITIENVEFKINEAVYRNTFLSFPTYEMAEEFLNNFKDLIEQAGDLI